MNSPHSAFNHEIMTQALEAREQVRPLEARKQELTEAIAPLNVELEGVEMGLRTLNKRSIDLANHAQNEMYAHLSGGRRNNKLSGQTALEYMYSLFELEGLKGERLEESMAALGRMVLPRSGGSVVPSVARNEYGKSIAGIHGSLNGEDSSQVRIGNPNSSGDIEINYATSQSGIQFASNSSEWMVRTRPGEDRLSVRRSGLIVTEDPELVTAHLEINKKRQINRSTIVAVGSEAVAALLEDKNNALRLVLSKISKTQIGPSVFLEDIAEYYPSHLKQRIAETDIKDGSKPHLPVIMMKDFAEPSLSSGELITAAAEGIVDNAHKTAKGNPRYIDDKQAIAAYEGSLASEDSITNLSMFVAVDEGARKVIKRAVWKAAQIDCSVPAHASDAVQVVFAKNMLDKAIREGGIFKHLSKEVRMLRKIINNSALVSK